MAATFPIPSTPLPLGESTFGPFSVPAGVSGFELRFNPRVLPDSSGHVLTEIVFDFSIDGGATTISPSPSTGIFGDPAFVDIKTGSTTVCVSRFSPVPSPSQLTVRARTVTAFTLSGASVFVS